MNDDDDMLEDRAACALDGRSGAAFDLSNLTPAGAVEGILTLATGATTGKTLARALRGTFDALVNVLAASDEQSFELPWPQCSQSAECGLISLSKSSKPWLASRPLILQHSWPLNEKTWMNM